MTMPSGWAGGNSTVFSNAGVAKAWVNFNGTGTVAVRASFNVSSITDNGTGVYTVNFTTAMPDTNYATTINTSYYAAGLGCEGVGEYFGGTRTVSAIQIAMQNINQGAYIDTSIISVTIFR